MDISQAFTSRSLSSLTKVFPDVELTEKPVNSGSALLQETYSFQVAYKGNQLMKHIRVRVSSDMNENITVRSAGLVPSDQHLDFILIRFIRLMR
jgi:hypothetical protein